MFKVENVRDSSMVLFPFLAVSRRQNFCSFIWSDKMIEFILHYWIQVLFSAILAFLSWCYKKIAGEVKARQAEMDLLKESNLALLHNEVFQLGKEYITKSEITFKEMDNFDMLYNAYHNLGGNGTGTEVYERVHNLTLKGE